MHKFWNLMMTTVIVTFIPTLAGCDAAGTGMTEPVGVWATFIEEAKNDVPAPALSPLDVYNEAAKYIGLAEVEGADSNTDIVAMLHAVGIRGSLLTDSTAWCGGFAHHVLAAMGIMSPKSAGARAYIDVGVGVSVAEAIKGDIAVLWRESISSWKGHVGFVHSIDLKAGTITMLGGNQGDMVQLETYSLSRILVIRRVL